eukprot:TRINITY_DN15832_c0_g1_i1.p1 TRINITY_DN15832_c0_g1~~TRINITY_DN15832_c0_g1_i1.p1  ORF type:complete len:802 (-),score=171.22 TRINITY_DN15832_c0_g1_i1:393-2798(-)
MTSSLFTLFKKSTPVFLGIIRSPVSRSFVAKSTPSRLHGFANTTFTRSSRSLLVKKQYSTLPPILANPWVTLSSRTSVVSIHDSFARSFSTSLFANKNDEDKKPDDQKQSKEKDENNKQEQGSGDPGGPNDPMDNRSTMMMYGLLALFIFLNSILNPSKEKSTQREITYDSFERELLFQNQVSRIEVDSGTANIYLKSKPEKPSYSIRIFGAESFVQRLEDSQKRLGLTPDFFVPVTHIHSRNEEESSGMDPWFILLIMASLFIMFNARNNSMRGPGGPGMGPGSNRGQDQLLDRLFGKQKAIFRKETNVKVSFKDIEGIDEAKMEVMELVHFLKNPEKYKALGAKVPKGALLTGEPGTGKTLLAKAIAGEAGIPFLATSGSEFVEMYVGVGAARVRDLFAEAKKSTPCIIFIDEIDAIGKARSSSPMRSNDERESCLNQLLVEMDGFSANSNIIVLASTNFADVLDPALLRPGRFDRQINVPKPDLKGRLAIFQLHMKDLKLGAEKLEIAKKLAPRTPGLTGADIANICNESALIAVRKNKESITLEDFHDAIDRVTLGFERRGMVITPSEKKIIAYHEAGHAIMSWFLKHTNNLSKVSIIPRGKGALGFAAVEQTDKFLMSDEEMEERMCVFLGGRVSEEIFFGSVTTGAQNDLSQVTRLAYAKIRAFGMNARVGLLSFPSENETYQKPYSELTAQMIDEEVRILVNKAYDTTKSTLLAKKELVIALAETLLHEETLLESDIEKILGPRPYSHIKMDYDQQVRDSERLKSHPKTQDPSPIPPTPVPVASSSDTHQPPAA